MTLIHSVAHGFVADDPVYFGNLNGGVPIVDGALYYIIASGLATDDFKFSATQGGAEFNITSDIVSGNVAKWPTYTVESGVMAPPELLTTPPDPTVTTGAIVDSTGTSFPFLTITLTPPANTNMRNVFVEVTGSIDGNGNPDWAQATRFALHPGDTTVTVPGLAAGQQYWVRTYSVDVFKQSSSYTNTVIATAAHDTVAPTTPKALEVVGTLRGIIASWDVGLATAGDLSFYEFRYCVGTPAFPATPDWKYGRTKTTTVFIGDLNPDPGLTGLPTARYWFQVRAVDTTGNTEDLTVPTAPVAVDFSTNPELGWCAALSGDPTMVDGDMVKLASLDTTHIATLDAGIIKTGHLLIDTTVSDKFDGIKVYNGSAQVGLWDETGLRVNDAADATDYVKLFAGGITVYRNGVPTTAITPDGIDASAITFGSLPGGGNLIKNSSFELAGFSTTAYSYLVDDVTADFAATDYGSDVNTTNSNALSINARTY